MPWPIEERDGKFCVVSSVTGHVAGCHATKAKARAQQRALYAKGVTAHEEIDGVRSSSDRVFNVPPNMVTASVTTDSNASSTVEMTAVVEAEDIGRGPRWEGPLGIEGHPTSDRRLLIPNEISERDLPLPLNVQLQTKEGHDESFNAGRIEKIEHIPIGEFSRAEEFGLEDLPERAIVIFAEGTFDRSEYASEARRMLDNGAGVSLDIARERVALFDPETLEEIADEKELGLEELLFGEHIQGFGGKIGGATIVTMAAFEEASIQVIEDRVLVASAYGFSVESSMRTLTADAGPLRPPRDWLQDPHLTELTPLTITKEGRVFGHLCDWGGCHVGFQGICVPPFRSPSNYAYFNTGEIETAEGDLVPCGTIMFSRDGAGHASTDPDITYQEAQAHYDDATHVGAFVRAGADRFGTWLAGVLRPDLNDLEIQHLRTHPPSGDWRPVQGVSELIAAFAVPVGGFPIPRQALVASADGEISAIITAPLKVELSPRVLRRRKIMLQRRYREAIGMEARTREQLRKEAMNWYDNLKTYTAEQRRRMARSGAAMPDGSFPIADCEDWMNARRSIGRAPESKRGAVQAHINRRGRTLGCSSDED